MTKSKLTKSSGKVLKNANKSAKEIERQKRQDLVLDVHKELNTGKDFVIMFDAKDRFKVLGKMDDQTLIEKFGKWFSDRGLGRQMITYIEYSMSMESLANHRNFLEVLKDQEENDDE